MSSEQTKELRVALEARMGEMAALLDEMAEALVYFPEDIAIVDDTVDPGVSSGAGQLRIKASSWPTIQEIDRVLSNWRALHNAKPRPGGRPRAA